MGKHRRPYLNAEGILSKVCRECDIEKPLVEFNLHNGKRSTSRRQECKICEAAYSRAWRERNPDRVRTLSREARRRESHNPRKMLDKRIQAGISNWVTGFSKSESAFQNLEFSPTELRAHLESRFVGRMEWSNYGQFGWHIEHAKPLAAFTYDTPSDPQFKEAWSLSNLRPTWWHENLWKGARYVAANDNEVSLDHRGQPLSVPKAAA